jgi:hypothetical protein
MTCKRYPLEVRKFLHEQLLAGKTSKEVEANLKKQFPDLFFPSKNLSGNITAYKRKLGLPVRKCKKRSVFISAKVAMPQEQKNHSPKNLLLEAMVMYLKTGHLEKARQLSELV